MAETSGGARTYTIDSVGPRIESFLKTIFESGGFKLNFTIGAGEAAHPEIENPDILVKFSGHDIDLLLANKGELLLALEHLTLEVLRAPSDHHALICFDANDYRMMRMEELRLTALTAAEKVKKTRVPFRFNPMTSRERRIIHLALRNDLAIRSESAGMGPARGVVIYPADMPTPPEPPAPPPSFQPRGDRGPRPGGDRGRGPRGGGGGDRGRSGPPRFRRDGPGGGRDR